MTLKYKNRVFLFLFALSSLNFLLDATAFCTAFLSHSLVPPSDPIRAFVLLPKAFLCPYSFPSVLVAILFFSAFAAFLSIVVFKSFEHTPSLEILFFSGFVVSCILESTRLFLPVFRVLETNSRALIALGRVVVAARFLAPASFFFAEIFSSTEELQNAQRNILFLAAATFAFAFFYPMNTMHLTTSCTVLWGFKGFFAAFRTFIFAVTIFTVLVDAYTQQVKRIYVKAVGMVVLFSGYALLCSTDCWLEFSVALLLLALGSLLYLKTVHYLENAWG